MLDARCAKVAQQLSHVFVSAFGGLQFNDKHALKKQIRQVFAYYGAVLIINGQRVLLPDMQSDLPQPMSQCILIDLLEMAVAMVLVDRKASLPDRVAQLHYVITYVSL